jgi:hypothetical protein
MKTNSTQLEVLLMTGTSFTSGQLANKDDDVDADQASGVRQLEEACWNGILPELLPEIFDKTVFQRKSYLWQIKEGKSFLELEWAEFPEKKDDFFSIDPYSFLAAEIFN